MEQFLNDCGLSAAIGTFRENNVIEIEQVCNLLTEEIKDLLPRIGDRATFREAVKRKRDEKGSTRHILKKQANDNSSKRNCVATEDNVDKLTKGLQKKDLIVQVLKNDEEVKVNLINKARQVVAPYLFETNHHDGGWDMIDYELAKLNCPLCPVQIMVQYRKDSYFDWMVENYLRHLENTHSAVKYLEYLDDSSCEETITQIASEQDLVDLNNATNNVVNDGENGLANEVDGNVANALVDDVQNDIETGVVNDDIIATGDGYIGTNYAYDLDGLNNATNNVVNDGENGLANEVDGNVASALVDDVQNGIENVTNDANGDGVSFDAEKGIANVVEDSVRNEVIDGHANVDTVANGNDDAVANGNDDAVANGNDDAVANGNDDAVANGNDDAVANGNDDAVANGNDDIPDWRRPDATFGWVKFNPRETFYPGFLYEDGLAQNITDTGELSVYKRPIHQYEEDIPEGRKRKKNKNLIKFNKKEGTSFK